MTNHGYGGVQIPVGGAPDTGGQNFYVNALALALENQGMEVTIFARGGFPFFGTNELREGEEWLSDHVRYVYIPGGGKEFIRKEDIAIALHEECTWLFDFIKEEAEDAGVKPWEYYECFNSHYWDAAVIMLLLVERWQDQIAFNFLTNFENGLFKEELKKFEGDNKHKFNLSREINRHLGNMVQNIFDDMDPYRIAQKLLPETTITKDSLDPSEFTAKSYREIEKSSLLGKKLSENIKSQDGYSLAELFKRCNRHIWTPHSLGIIKERNFWDKDKELIRSLKFCERNDHEETVCLHTPLFCSTSPEIWTTLFSFHNQKAETIYDFPPCIDNNAFKPRQKSELTELYEYLEQTSGIDAEKLKSGRIIFESSRMDRTKRKDILLKAFEPIAQSTTDVYLFIGGGPQSSPVFNRLIKILKSQPALKGRAFLLGFIPENMLELMFSAPTIFVSASEMEGFGMSASQAAAAKIPVICSNLIPFATQYAQDAAVVVKAGDVQGFTDAMMRLLNDKKEREERAQKLYEIALELNWDTTAKNFVSWYRKYFNQHLTNINF
jgi:glycosyltransferase involved in cell wall biosynthesis